MKRSVVSILVTDHAWIATAIQGREMTCLELGPSDDTSVIAKAQRISERARALGIVPGPVVLAVPSAWCMNALLDLENGDRVDRKSLLFDLEERLPIAAEQVSAGFVIGGDKALGVCIEKSRLQPILDALESQGWSIACVGPISLLAMSRWLDEYGRAEPVDALLFEESDQLILLTASEGKPLAWFVMPPDADDLNVRLELLSQRLGRAPRLLKCGAGTSGGGLLKNLDAAHATRCVETDLHHAAAGAAEQILSGKAKPLVNLLPPDHRWAANGYLHRPMAAALIGLVALLVMTMVAFLIASWRLNHQTSSLMAEQRRLFYEVTTNAQRQPPPEVYRYLCSELQRLGGQSEQSIAARQSGQAMLMLSDLFGRIPDQVPIQLERVEIVGPSAELSGRVLSHEDAGKLAASLCGDGVLSVEPPQTNVMSDRSVNFVLHVQRAGMAKEGP